MKSHSLERRKFTIPVILILIYIMYHLTQCYIYFVEPPVFWVFFILYNLIFFYILYNLNFFFYFVQPLFFLFCTTSSVFFFTFTSCHVKRGYCYPFLHASSVCAVKNEDKSRCLADVIHNQFFHVTSFPNTRTVHNH